MYEVEKDWLSSFLVILKREVLKRRTSQKEWNRKDFYNRKQTAGGKRKSSADKVEERKKKKRKSKIAAREKANRDLVTRTGAAQSPRHHNIHNIQTLRISQHHTIFILLEYTLFRDWLYSIDQTNWEKWKPTH